MILIKVLLVSIFAHKMFVHSTPGTTETAESTSSSAVKTSFLSWRKPNIGDDHEGTPNTGNDLDLPVPVKTPSKPDPSDVFEGFKDLSVLEVSNEQEDLFEQLNRFLTDTYGNQLTWRRLFNQRKSLEDEIPKFTYLIAAGRSYILDLMNPSDSSGIGFNTSRSDQNPFFFGSLADLKIQVEVWETEHPVGLQARPHVYRRLVLKGRKETLEALCRKSYEYIQAPVGDADHISAYTSTHWGGWTTPAVVAKRPLNTVYLEGDLRETILADIKRFYASKDVYKKFAIPYRHSVLLAGPPGTGKTSLIKALASEMDKNIGLLQFSKYFGPSDLAKALSTIPADFLVIEDVDSLYAGRGTDAERNGLTFSDFINAVDGICSREGIVLFMTTNHPENLDPALIRPGRVDLLVNIGHITESQALQMFQNYFPDQLDYFEGFYEKVRDDSLSTAELQNFFFHHLECEDIRDHVDTFLEASRRYKESTTRPVSEPALKPGSDWCGTKPRGAAEVVVLTKDNQSEGHSEDQAEDHSEDQAEDQVEDQAEDHSEDRTEDLSEDSEDLSEDQTEDLSEDSEDSEDLSE